MTRTFYYRCLSCCCFCKFNSKMCHNCLSSSSWLISLLFVVAVAFSAVDCQSTTLPSTTTSGPRSYFQDLWFVPLIVVVAVITFLSAVFILRKSICTTENIRKSKPCKLYYNSGCCFCYSQCKFSYIFQIIFSFYSRFKV